MAVKRLLLVLSLVCLNGLPLSVQARGADWSLSTDDTEIQVGVSGNRPLITRLAGRGQTHNWAPRAMDVPLMAIVWVDQREVTTDWTFKQATTDDDSGRLTLVFANADPRLLLRSVWRARPGHGPIEHWMEIENLSDRVVTVSHQDSLVLKSLDPAGPATLWHVKHGGGKPDDGGAFTDRLNEDTNLHLGCAIRNSHIPWLAIQVREDRGVYVGWEFSSEGRIQATAREGGNAVEVRVGLSADFKTDVEAGTTFLVPPAFVGCYAGDVDEGSYRLHRFCIQKLRLPVPKGWPDPLTGYFTYWGADDEAAVLELAKRGQEYGFEIFEIDARWFPSAGDWRWQPDRFPNGGKPIEEFVHGKDMRFAMWCAWVAGGSSDHPEATNVHRHGDFFPQDLPPTFELEEGTWNGPPMCLGSVKSRDWGIQTLKRVASRDKVDLIKEDLRYTQDRCSRTTHRHRYDSVDVSYWSTMGYYEVLEAVQKDFPNLVFEHAASGLFLIDYGCLRRCHYMMPGHPRTSLKNRRCAYDSSFALPPLILINYTGGVWYTESEGIGPYSWRSGMMYNFVHVPKAELTAGLSQELERSLKRSVHVYKHWIRPILKDCKVHHILPRPDGKRWDGLFYWSPSLEKGTLYIFRPESDEASRTVRLKGLDAEKDYWLWCEDGSIDPGRHSGRELMRQGLDIALPGHYTSDLIFVQDAQPGEPVEF